MISDVTVRKADNDQPPLFELAYVDLGKKEQKGYFRTTRYGAEPELRRVLEDCGVPNAEIDSLFENAKKFG